jgi:hypothetical protein
MSKLYNNDLIYRKGESNEIGLLTYVQEKSIHQ